MWFLFAIGCTFAFGIRGILYHWTSQRPINRNLMLTGVFFSGALIGCIITFLQGETWTMSSLLVGLCMGICSCIGNAAIYKGYAVGRASLIAMCNALPPVVVVIIAYFLWGETLNNWQLLSFMIIMSGLLLVRYSNDFSLDNLQGIQWGLLSMLFFGFTDVLAKQATLLQAPKMPTLSVMFFTGFVFLFILWRKDVKAKAKQNKEENKEKPSTIWTNRRIFFWGMAVGITNILGMFLSLMAFEVGVTGLVAVMIAANVVIIMLYARFVLKERFSRPEVAGLFTALIGIFLLRFMG